MATGTTNPEASTEALSLQARAEQLEGAIETAHTILSRIAPLDDASEKVPATVGAVAVIDRCNREITDLNQRLASLAERVGVL